MNDLYLIRRFIVFLDVLFEVIIEVLPFIILWSIFYTIDYFFGFTIVWIGLIIMWILIVVFSYGKKWNEEKELLTSFKW